MSKSQGNVQFLAVSRLSFGQALILASFSFNAETDLEAVKQVVQQPNMSLAPGILFYF
jgi:hypothetical protein